MDLTRRDAIAVLAGLGLTTSAWTTERFRENKPGPISDRDVKALVLLAETLYPSGVEVTPEFIEAYVIGQHVLDENHTRELKSVLKVVRGASVRTTGRSLYDLGVRRRGEVLRSTGADRAIPKPSGTDAERIRYYVVNNLLYALYTSPKGTSLVGNPNPPGYPGGTLAYQEASSRD